MDDHTDPLAVHLDDIEVEDFTDYAASYSHACVCEASFVS